MAVILVLNEADDAPNDPEMLDAIWAELDNIPDTNPVPSSNADTLVLNDELFAIKLTPIILPLALILLEAVILPDVIISLVTVISPSKKAAPKVLVD